ncbi:MAG: tRNA preQ1(34) S-adenosylmethionine ribosyltransferase-isomerase QueA [Alicyclobacillus sp.]|nr:tRNA preQ1(34) S-adenosylmethionine ribosyltransferase-isomerase QueA [Alicyclobacillus sp.]
MRVDDFDYELPAELIAQTPAEHRTDARLMVVDPVEHSLVHTRFWRIGEHLHPGDVLVFNNSKVIPARLWVRKADTGAVVELLLSRQVNEHEWEALARPAKRLHQGAQLQVLQGMPPREGGGTDSGVTALVTEELAEGLRRVRFHLHEPMEAFLDRVGTMPLPPYIQQPPADRDRYQTVYAAHAGSVAAPTAGFHFTHELLDRLRAQGVETHFVTLHVGLGTFKPVTVERVEEHRMHTERYYVPPEVAAAVTLAKREGRRVIAVGTTSLRTLESAWSDGALQVGGGETGIFIYPGYRFQVVDALVTNFHLPKSTLIMLVAAFMGLAFTKEVYRVAVEQRYRFFSFGDAMFITRWVPGLSGGGAADGSCSL